jgi:hypothetical protein
VRSCDCGGELLLIDLLHGAHESEKSGKMDQVIFPAGKHQEILKSDEKQGKIREF